MTTINRRSMLGLIGSVPLAAGFTWTDAEGPKEAFFAVNRGGSNKAYLHAVKRNGTPLWPPLELEDAAEFLFDPIVDVPCSSCQSDTCQPCCPDEPGMTCASAAISRMSGACPPPAPSAWNAWMDRPAIALTVDSR